jgi:hypothetical protein
MPTPTNCFVCEDENNIRTRQLKQGWGNETSSSYTNQL